MTTDAETRTHPRSDDVLRSTDTAPRLIRGSSVRGAGYALGIGIQAATSILLLRYLGVVEFGEFVTVMSLIAIVSGVTDAGLTAVGSRELALRTNATDRERLLGNIVTLRMLLTPIGVALAVGFAIVAGYSHTLVLGTLIAGFGLILISLQATMMLPLSVDLRLSTVTVFEVARQLIAMIAIVVLVVIGAALLPFFAVTIPAGLIVLVVTPIVLRPASGLKPRFDHGEWRMLIREAIPIAVSLTMNAVYFRVLIILMSLLASGVATGLYGTSFRVFEIAFGIPSLVLSSALPVLAAAASDGDQRLAYVLQRMTEVGLVAATLMALLIAILAEPVLRLLGGVQYVDAAPLLRIQAFALLGVFLGQTCQLGLISIHRQKLTTIANGVALVIVIGLGISFISLWGATGAAVTAVIAESILGLLMLGLLAYARRAVRPHFGFIWKPILAGLVAAAPLLIPGIPALVAAALAAILFSAVAWVTRAVPHEVLHAHGLSRLVTGSEAGA